MNFWDKAIDRLGALAAWLFFATGMLLTWEVVARYVFSAPTIWAAEISQMFLIWGMYVALPHTIARRKNINIEILHERLPGWAQRFCDMVTIVFTGFFCAVVFWYGWEIASDSWRYKEVSWNSPARIQIYLFKTLIPLGFGISLVVCAADLLKLLRGKPLAKPAGNGDH